MPFATFFLQKILSRSSGKVDIDHLASLDPEMYRNLLYLKNYHGNVEDLGLDFTIVDSEIGRTEVNKAQFYISVLFKMIITYYNSLRLLN